MIEVWDGSRWVEDQPVHGQKYRKTIGGSVLVTYWKEETKEDVERKWRDVELSSTDWIVPLTDHPQHANYLTYRQELRDYPSQIDFPNGERPTL